MLVFRMQSVIILIVILNIIFNDFFPETSSSCLHLRRGLHYGVQHPGGVQPVCLGDPWQHCLRVNAVQAGGIRVPVYGPGVLLTTLRFLRNLLMGPISKHVTLHNAEKAYQRQTL
jgi:hypothetical protein